MTWDELNKKAPPSKPQPSSWAELNARFTPPPKPAPAPQTPTSPAPPAPVTPPLVTRTTPKPLRVPAAIESTALRLAANALPIPGVNLLPDKLLKKGKDAAKQVATDVVQGAARSGGSVGLTLTGTPELRAEDQPSPVTQAAHRVLFGEKPLKSIPSRINDAEKEIEPYTGKKAARALATAGVVGLTAADFTGSGGEKKATKYAAKVAVENREVAEYIAENVVRRSRAAGRTPEILEKAGSLLKTAKTKLVDFAAPIEDVLADTIKANKLSLKPSEHISNQIDRVLRTPAIAGQFVKDGGLEEVIKAAPDIDALDQYLIARHAKTVAANGVKTGRDAVKDGKLLEALAPEYEPLAKAVTEYSQKLLDYSVDSGLISKDLAKKLKEAYPDYVPLNRIFAEDEIVDHGFSGGRSIASLSKQTIVQKLSGSEREIASPLESLMAKTNDAFRQGEKNKAARILASYKDLPGNPFQIVPLRTAENVERRIDLYSEAKELKPLQNKIARFIKSRGRDLQRLEVEINRLNKKGLHLSLKPAKQEALPGLTAAHEVTRVPEGPEKLKFAADDSLLSRQPGTPAKTIVKDARLVVPSASDVKKFVNALVSDPDADIQLIKKKIATRENKLGPLLDTIATLKSNLESVRSYRSELRDEARLLSDAKTRGKSTFSLLNNGVKEIYETTPEVADAAKALNVQQLNILGKILAFPVRVAKLGITGINIPFVASNIVKDQVTAFINSNKALSTSIANPQNFVRALFSAIKHDDLYEELVREGAGGTSFDIARDQIPATISRIRASRSIGSRALYTVRHPSELLRTVEDIIGRSEELTRLQQYRGTREALLKEGMSEAEAKIAAAKAARENTVNFARRGEWGTVLNSAFLYLNAGIQGTRTLVRSAATRPLQTGAKITTALFLPISIATAWNMTDPERRKAYEDIAEYEKQNNLIIVPPNPTQDERGRWNVIKIPLAQGVNNLATVPRRALEQAFGHDQVRATELAQALIGTVSPIAPEKGAILSSITPQAVKPSLEVGSNVNFFTGRQIVPQYMTEKPTEKQAFKNTSGSARRIGKAFNVSPLKVEAFIKETFGGVGTQAINAIDQALAAGKLIPKEQIGGESTFEAVVRRFKKATGGEIERKEEAKRKKR